LTGRLVDGFEGFIFAAAPSFNSLKYLQFEVGLEIASSFS
jgi:hypothetical protein